MAVQRIPSKLPNRSDIRQQSRTSIKANLLNYNRLALFFSIFALCLHLSIYVHIPLNLDSLNASRITGIRDVDDVIEMFVSQACFFDCNCSENEHCHWDDDDSPRVKLELNGKEYYHRYDYGIRHDVSDDTQPFDAADSAGGRDHVQIHDVDSGQNPFKKGYQCLSFSNLRIFFRLASKNIWLHWSENQLTDRETEQDSRGELEQVVCISGRGVSAKYYLRPVLFFHEASKTNQFSEVNHILATGWKRKVFPEWKKGEKSKKTSVYLK